MTFILVWLGGPAWSPTGAQILFAYRDVQNGWISAALYQRSAIGQSAWVRADYVVQDHASGALPFRLRSGGNEAYLGIERIESSELARLGKGNLQGEVQRALKILHHLFTVASLTYGFSGDTPESVRLMFRRGHELRGDEIFIYSRHSMAWNSILVGVDRREISRVFVRGPGDDSAAFAFSNTLYCPRVGLGLASSVGSEMSSAGGCAPTAGASHCSASSTGGGRFYPAWHES